VVAALVALLPLAAAAPAEASSDALDQSSTLMLNLENLVPFMAQTFTAGTTAGLDRVSLATDTPTSFARATVTIRSVGSGGLPSTTVLGTASTLAGSLQCCRQFHDFTFSPAVPVTKGTQYAIVVQVSSGVVDWYDSGGLNVYTGGREYIGGQATSWITPSHFDFAFKTWVLSSANTAPTVAAGNPGVNVPEGTAPSNSGTYSDADGDTVAITASVGTVTKTGTASGTWSWAQPASDETPSRTVTIKADDGHGLTATTSFTVEVTAVAPTAQILTDPVTVPEGSPADFTGGATSPDTVDNTAGFTYSWTVLKDGNAYATGSGTAFTFTPDDDGTYAVTLQATDDGGMTGTASLTVTATNVSPLAAIDSIASSLPLVTTAGEYLVFGGSFKDVDTSIDSYTTTWDFGDGSTGTGSTVTHAYANPGTYTVTFEVSDGEGGFGMDQQTVTVQTTEQALTAIAAYIQGLPGLNNGQKNSLTAKLDAASASAARGNDIAASNQLNALLNELQAGVNSGRVPAGTASTLQGAISAVQDSLGAFNHF
jgi:hypothetical protein